MPPSINRGLNILFAAAVVSLLSSFPYFQPVNIFTVTESRLQIPTDVLFNRLITRQKHLTPRDELLKSRFDAMDVRLQYLAFGPDPIIDCLFCSPDEPNSYLYYAIPSTVTPHLLHIGLLGLITSPTFFRTEGEPMAHASHHRRDGSRGIGSLPTSHV